MLLLTDVYCAVECITFKLFPVGDPHGADTVGLSGKVFEVDHDLLPCLGNDHWALNTCNQEMCSFKGRKLYKIHFSHVFNNIMCLEPVSEHIRNEKVYPLLLLLASLHSESLC